MLQANFLKKVLQNVQNVIQVITHLVIVPQTNVFVVQQEKLMMAKKEKNNKIPLIVFVVVLMNMHLKHVQQVVYHVKKDKQHKEKHANLNVLNVKIAKKLNLV